MEILDAVLMSAIAYAVGYSFGDVKGYGKALRFAQTTFKKHSTELCDQMADIASDKIHESYKKGWMDGLEELKRQFTLNTRIPDDNQNIH